MTAHVAELQLEMNRSGAHSSNATAIRYLMLSRKMKKLNMNPAWSFRSHSLIDLEQHRISSRKVLSRMFKQADHHVLVSFYLKANASAAYLIPRMDWHLTTGGLDIQLAFCKAAAHHTCTDIRKYI